MHSPSFFVLLVTLSHQIYARFSSLEMSAIIETLMQCAEWPQFAVNHFRISLIWSKATKLQLLEITSKHCSEAVCTPLLRVAGTITDVACNATDVACNASISEQVMANQLKAVMFVSLCLYVYLVVYHTCDPPLKGSRYRNMGLVISTIEHVFGSCRKIS